MARKTNFNVNGYNYYKVTKTIGHKENREPIKKVFYGSSKSEAEQKLEFIFFFSTFAIRNFIY